MSEAAAAARKPKIALAPRNNDENRDFNACNNRPQQGLISKPHKPAAAAAAAAAPVQESEPPPVQEVEYVLSEDLKPLQDPEAQLKTLAARLGSRDWLTVCDALNQVRQICIFQPDMFLPILENVMTLVLKAVKNPRSALCKTAIMACSDLFQAYQDQLLELFDPLLLQLLLKASQDKKFVCEEAEKALLSMTTWLSPVLLIRKLQSYTTHRNPRVRAKSAMCVSRSVSRLGAEGIKEYGVEPLLQIAAAHFTDQLPEAREAARNLVVELGKAYRQEPDMINSEICCGSSSSSSSSDSDGEKSPTSKWERLCSSIVTPAVSDPILRDQLIRRMVG